MRNGKVGEGSVLAGWAALGRVLTNRRRFGIFVLGTFLFYVARWFVTLAASIVAYDLTDSSLVVGIVNASQFLPALLLSPWTGRVADTYDRRAVIAWTSSGIIVAIVVMAAAAFADILTVPILIGVMTVIGLLNAFTAPATLALALQLVDEEDHDVALSLNAMQFNLARAFGPMIGAILLTEIGLGSSLTVTVALTVALVAVIPLVRPVAVPDRPTGSEGRMRVATAFLRKSDHGWVLIAAGALVSGMNDVVTTVAPALAGDLTGEASDAGLLLSFFGAGAAAYAILLQPLLRRVRRQIAALMMVQGVGMIVMSMAPNIVVACAGSALSGAAFLGASTRTATMLQASAPRAMVGRILALWTVAVLGIRPAGSLITGLLADALSAKLAVVLLAGVLILGGAAFGYRLRRLDRLTPDDPPSALPPSV